MCGACGASMGGMVSYEVGEVVEISHPPYIDARTHGTIARIQSIDPEFGIEVLFPDTTIAWIGWGPFSCVLEFPKFVIGRIGAERFVLMDTSNNNKSDGNGDDDGDGDGDDDVHANNNQHLNTTIAHQNNKVISDTTEEGDTTTLATSATTSNHTATMEYVTIGQGWLRAPFVLPHKLPVATSSSSSSSSTTIGVMGVPLG